MTFRSPRLIRRISLLPAILITLLWTIWLLAGNLAYEILRINILNTAYPLLLFIFIFIVWITQVALALRALLRWQLARFISLLEQIPITRKRSQRLGGSCGSLPR